MSVYNCPRCGYSTTRRLNLEKHYNKVKPCDSIISDIDINKYKDALLLDKSGIVLSIIKEKDDLLEQNKLLTKKINSLTINVDNNHHNNTTITNNNNIDIKIILNPINEPNLDYITEKDANRCLKNMKTAMLEMAKKIFFNTNHPENMSVYKTSCKNNLIKYFKDGGWNIGDQDIVVDIMTESINDGLELADNSDKYHTLAHEYATNDKFKKKIDNLLVTECYNSSHKR